MNDYTWVDETVAVGSLKFDGTADMPVRIVGLPYDYFYSLAEADGHLEPNEEPCKLGPEGLLYYVVFAELAGPSFPTILQAKGYAQSQVQSPISWR